MSFEEHKEFEQNMNQLIRFLSKMIKNIPNFPQGGPPKFSGKDKDSGVNVNFCFFTFLPVNPEDLEEMDEIYERFLAEEEKMQNNCELSGELSPSDLDFLRRNGIRF